MNGAWVPENYSQPQGWNSRAGRASRGFTFTLNTDSKQTSAAVEIIKTLSTSRRLLLISNFIFHPAYLPTLPERALQDGRAESNQDPPQFSWLNADNINLYVLLAQILFFKLNSLFTSRPSLKFCIPSLVQVGAEVDGGRGQFNTIRKECQQPTFS